MTESQIAGFILIILMIGIVFLACRYLSGEKYNGHGIYHITVNAWFRGNMKYRSWLRENKDYHWCILLVMALCPMILLLIEPFSKGRVFVRPEASIYVNIILWIAIFKTYYWLFKKLGKL